MWEANVQINFLRLPLITYLEETQPPILLHMFDAFDQIRASESLHKVERIRPSPNYVIMENIPVSKTNSNDLVYSQEMNDKTIRILI